MKQITLNTLLIIIALIIISILVHIFFFLIPNMNKDYKIYYNDTEVDNFTIKSGFDATQDWNNSKFIECANKSYYSEIDWYDSIYECMNKTGIKIIYSNLSKEDLNVEFLNLNCEKIEDEFLCGEYIMKK